MMGSSVRFQIESGSSYLLFPVKRGNPQCRVRILHQGEEVRFFTIELSDFVDCEWEARVDGSEWAGSEVEVVVEGRGFGDGVPCRLGDGSYTPGAYGESLRPQYHFSPYRGWMNDPNGLVYYGGEYHLFFQHNPYGWGWGNMTWGHAVSQDLLHWRELGDVLHPDRFGAMFSGSGVCDVRNSSGFGDGDRAPLVLIYTAAGNPFTQCVAYSCDGRTFHKHAGNPVIGNIDKGNRDPKVFWHEGTGRWVMALYVGHQNESEYTVELHGSSDLLHWERLSVVPGGKGDNRYLYECPDMFELCVEGSDQRRWVLTAANGEYQIGDFDGVEFVPESSVLRSCEGIAYASQTFDGLADGRRVMMSWLRAESPGMPFNQCQSVPQELSLVRTSSGLRLSRKPLRELVSLRRRSYAGSGLLDYLGDSCEIRLVRSHGHGLDFSYRGLGLSIKDDALELCGHRCPWRYGDGDGEAVVLYVDRTTIECFSEDGLNYVSIGILDALGGSGYQVSPGVEVSLYELASTLGLQN